MQYKFYEYFENLSPWDGIDHIGNLAGYLKQKELAKGVDETARLKSIFRKMLVKMVAGSLGSGSNKQVLVLIGPQHIGKTMFLNWLCPPELPSLITNCTDTSKEGLIKLTKNFLVQINVLDQDCNKMKKAILTDQIKVRLPYTNEPEIIKRRCSFVAATNSTDFLNNEEIRIRWVCFNLAYIIWNYQTEIDIKKVWSQAFHLFKNDNNQYQLSWREMYENKQANTVYLWHSTRSN